MDEQSDIWAVGVCLFYLLTGVLPFPCKAGEARRMIMGQVLPLP